MTHYLYDGWNRIAEFTGQSLDKVYLWGMDLSGTMQGAGLSAIAGAKAGGVGGLLSVSEVQNGQVISWRYPTYDGNGNVSEYIGWLDDADPNISGNQPGYGSVAHFEYDPFGNLTVDSENNAASFPYRFSTKPQDPVTGLLYYGYRFYDPLTGRWPSRDPIEEDGGVNLYGFVGNSNSYLDCLGLQIISGESEQFRDKVKISLEKVVGSRLKWVKIDKVRKHTEMNKPEYWFLQPAEPGTGELFDHLNIGMAPGLPTIDIKSATWTDNALGGRASQYRGVEINLGIATGNPVETGNKDDFGFERYSTEKVADFDPNLWHELVGHGCLGFKHPLKLENVYSYVRAKALIAYERNKDGKSEFEDPGLATPDPTIQEENKARVKLGLRLRRPQYIDDFLPVDHWAYVRPPGNWEYIKKRAEQVKPRKQ